jgi:protein-disulfide isomerase
VPNSTDQARPRARFHLHLTSVARPLAVALALALSPTLAAGCARGEAPDPTGDAVAAAESYAGIPQEGDVLGNPYAPVTLADFSDLRCSHCRDLDQITLPVIVDRYVRTGQVRVIFQDLPILGQASVQAARMAVAVSFQDHLFEFVDAFYAADPGVVSDDALQQIAASVPGVDATRALTDSESSEVTSALAQIREMTQQLSIFATPTLLLGPTGGTLHTVSGVWPDKPETVTGPIDALLSGHDQG